jgi:hypothetical protein
VIRDCSFFDLTDDAANSRYGYGIDAFGPTRDGRVAGCFMNGGRHAFTTNGYGIGVTSEGLSAAYPRRQLRSDEHDGVLLRHPRRG